MKKTIKIDKKTLLHYGLIYTALIVLCFFRALGTYMFIVPNGFAPGGVSGIASIIYNIVLPFDGNLAETVFNPAVTVFVLNIPLFIWAFLKLDKRFAFNTLFSVSVFSAFMGMFSAIDFPVFQGSNIDSGILLLASVTGGVILGFVLGFMLKLNSSMGGTDIIGKVIYKKDPIADVQWLIFMCDCVVVVFSGAIGLVGIKDNGGTVDIIVRIITPILYSFISLFACSKAADIVQMGFESSTVFNIVTSEPEKLSAAIIEKLHRGVTVMKGEGMYTHAERDMLICVIRKKQLTSMKRLVKSVDPNAFMYITTAKEVRGKGFITQEEDEE